jgi:TolB-like protein
VAAVGLGYLFFANRSANATQIESIAVLPFENQNLDTEYLSDGLTESIINNLTKLPNLRVINRNSVFRYKGKATDSAAVGQELNVRAVLTGRIVQRGDNLIISAELTDLRITNKFGDSNTIVGRPTHSPCSRKFRGIFPKHCASS